MVMQQLIPHSECALVETSHAWTAAVERAQRRVLEPYAPSTQRAYRLAWRQWRAHCDALHVPALPIEPSHLVSYLESREDLSPNSVRLHLAALCTLDSEAQIEHGGSSLRKHVIITRWLKAWSREHPRAPKKKAPAVQRSELDRLLQAVQERDPNGSRLAHAARAVRDRCLILFGIVGGFRGAELAGLELADVEQLERGLRVCVSRSKTDQAGVGHYRGLFPQGQRGRCPVAAWTDWLAVRGPSPGAAFVPIARTGELELELRLSTDAIRRMVRSRARSAGLRLSSHSMRASFITLAREKGRPLDQIAAHVGHRSLDTTRGYCRQVDLFDDNPTAGMLDD